RPDRRSAAFCSTTFVYDRATSRNAGRAVNTARSRNCRRSTGSPRTSRVCSGATTIARTAPNHSETSETDLSSIASCRALPSIDQRSVCRPIGPSSRPVTRAALARSCNHRDDRGSRKLRSVASTPTASSRFVFPCALSPNRTTIGAVVSSVVRVAFRKPWTSSEVSRNGGSLHPHRHHDELAVVAIGDPHDARVERVAHLELDAVALRRAEDVLEVLHVEAGHERLALDLGRDLLARVAHVDVRRAEDEAVLLEREAHRVVAIGRDDRDAAKRVREPIRS